MLLTTLMLNRGRDSNGFYTKSYLCVSSLNLELPIRGLVAPAGVFSRSAKGWPPSRHICCLGGSLCLEMPNRREPTAFGET